MTQHWRRSKAPQIVRVVRKLLRSLVSDYSSELGLVLFSSEVVASQLFIISIGGIYLPTLPLYILVLGIWGICFKCTKHIILVNKVIALKTISLLGIYPLQTHLIQVYPVLIKHKRTYGSLEYILSIKELGCEAKSFCLWTALTRLLAQKREFIISSYREGLIIPSISNAPIVKERV